MFFANKNVTLGNNPNTFVSNKAIYGDIFASQPSVLDWKYELTSNFKFDNGLSLLFSRRLQQKSLYLQIVSGGLFSFNTTVMDASGS